MITLFSNNCPRCRVLETKLNTNNIPYQKNSDMDEIISAGFMSAPVLKVDDFYYDFANAVKWVSNFSADNCNECRLD